MYHLHRCWRHTVLYSTYLWKSIQIYPERDPPVVRSSTLAARWVQHKHQHQHQQQLQVGLGPGQERPLSLASSTLQRTHKAVLWPLSFYPCPHAVRRLFSRYLGPRFPYPRDPSPACKPHGASSPDPLPTKACTLECILQAQELTKWWLFAECANGTWMFWLGCLHSYIQSAGSVVQSWGVKQADVDGGWGLALPTQELPGTQEIIIQFLL